MTTEITNSDDLIDSRDVIARIEELQDERDTAIIRNDEDSWDEAEQAAAFAKWADENPEDAAELAALKALADEAEGYAPDWQHGETLIRESYFVTYAEQLAEDIGAIDRNAQWPLMHIDWDAAADALKQDYTAVEFDGVTYYVR